MFGSRRTWKSVPRRASLLAAASFAFVALVGPWPARWADDDFQSADPVAENRRLVAAWSEALADPTAPPGPLTAGAAKVNVLDTLRRRWPGASLTSIPLAGYGKRAFVAGNWGEADPIYAKAVVFDDGVERIAVATADVLLIPRSLAEAVVARVQGVDGGFERRQVYFGATHTHSSLGGISDRVLEMVSTGRPRPEVFDALAESMAEAIRIASARRQVCRIAWGGRRLPPGGYVQNRTLRGGPTNDWLDVLSVRNADDRAILASVVVFGAHATCRSRNDLAVSADYPGVLAARVEQATGAPCLFLAGGVGGMGPPGMPPPRDGWAEKLGESLADEALMLIEKAEPGGCELACLGGDVQLPAPSVKATRNLRISPLLARALLPSRAWLQGARIGDRVLLATPADFGGETAVELRNVSPELTCVVTSFGGDFIGYALPARRYHLSTYEPRSACLYGPRLGECLVDAGGEIVRRLTAPRGGAPALNPSSEPPTMRTGLAN
jgi:hypothetical protein